MNIELSQEIARILAKAKDLAKRYNNSQINSLCLLFALLNVSDKTTLEAISESTNNNNNETASNRYLIEELSQRVLEKLTGNPEEIDESDSPDFDLDNPHIWKVIIDQTTGRILRLTLLESQLHPKGITQGLHMLLAMLKENHSEAFHILNDAGVTYQRICSFLEEMPTNTDDNTTQNKGKFVAIGNIETLKQSDLKEQDTSDTPILDRYTTDITLLAKDGLLDPIIGREKELLRIQQILSRRKKNNPLLIGEAGVGKSAIVEGLAQLIVNNKVPHSLHGKHILSLNMAALVAGSKYRGEFEERIENLIKEIHTNPKYILFFDEIHTLIGTGAAAGGLDAANILKPALARGEIQCIGATTFDEYRQSIEKDGALNRRFQTITLEPTTEKETLHILRNIKGRYEDYHHVHYTEDALMACVQLTQRYLTDRALPDKAIDILDEAGSRLHVKNDYRPQAITDLENQIKRDKEAKKNALKHKDFVDAANIRDSIKKKEEELKTELEKWKNTVEKKITTIDEDDIAKTISLISGIPLKGIMLKENDKLRKLKNELNKHVIAQDNAIEKLSKVIIRNKLGLKGHERPIGAFLFVGPTGVGKTYMVKCLAKAMFGSEKNLIRIDMSEYGEQFTSSRLIGAPPGYVGYNEGGELTERIRRHPYSVILLDEIEKAHPNIFNVLLQVMDEGRLTDGNGNTVDFRNTIIIMTSNIGTQQLKAFGRGIGFNAEENNTQHSESIIKKEIERKFTPEFLNRLDHIILFNSLNKKDATLIVDLELEKLRNRLKEMNLRLTLTPAAKDYIVKEGFDTQYGARSLKRAIETLIEDNIANLLINNAVYNNNKKKEMDIHFNIEKGKLKYNISTI